MNGKLNLSEKEQSLIRATRYLEQVQANEECITEANIQRAIYNFNLSSREARGITVLVRNAEVFKFN